MTTTMYRRSRLLRSYQPRGKGSLLAEPAISSKPEQMLPSKKEDVKAPQRNAILSLKSGTPSAVRVPPPVVATSSKLEPSFPARWSQQSQSHLCHPNELSAVRLPPRMNHLNRKAMQTKNGWGLLTAKQKSPEKVKERRGIVVLGGPSKRPATSQNRVDRQSEAQRILLRLKPDISGLHKMILAWDYDAMGDNPPGFRRFEACADPRSFYVCGTLYVRSQSLYYAW